MKIKTIDINAKEWFDKINGNSYFSGEIVLNFGMKTEKTLFMPFQYGYGDHYQEMAFKEIQEFLKIEIKGVLWRYCQEHNIILRANKQENFLKRYL